MSKVKLALPTDGYNWDTSKFIVFKTRSECERNTMTQEHDYKKVFEEVKIAAMQSAGADKWQFEIDSTLPFSDRGFAFNKGNYLAIESQKQMHDALIKKIEKLEKALK